MFLSSFLLFYLFCPTLSLFFTIFISMYLFFITSFPFWSISPILTHSMPIHSGIARRAVSASFQSFSFSFFCPPTKNARRKIPAGEACRSCSIRFSKMQAFLREGNTDFLARSLRSHTPKSEQRKIRGTCPRIFLILIWFRHLRAAKLCRGLLVLQETTSLLHPT